MTFLTKPECRIIPDKLSNDTWILFTLYSRLRFPRLSKYCLLPAGLGIPQGETPAPEPLWATLCPTSLAPDSGASDLRPSFRTPLTKHAPVPPPTAGRAPHRRHRASGSKSCLTVAGWALTSSLASVSGTSHSGDFPLQCPPSSVSAPGKPRPFRNHRRVLLWTPALSWRGRASV